MTVGAALRGRPFFAPNINIKIMCTDECQFCTLLEIKKGWPRSATPTNTRRGRPFFAPNINIKIMCTDECQFCTLLEIKKGGHGVPPLQTLAVAAPSSNGKHCRHQNNVTEEHHLLYPPRNQEGVATECHPYNRFSKPYRTRTVILFEVSALPVARCNSAIALFKSV